VSPDFRHGSLVATTHPSVVLSCPIGEPNLSGSTNCLPNIAAISEPLAASGKQNSKKKSTGPVYLLLGVDFLETARFSDSVGSKSSTRWIRESSQDGESSDLLASRMPIPASAGRKIDNARLYIVKTDRIMTRI
jgi:hypothetical protein